MVDEGDTLAAVEGLGDLATQQSQEGGHASAGMLAVPAAGTRIGRFVVERLLGRGGMGIVLGARHETLGELVAIKLLHPSANKDKVQVERFVREARSTVRIKSEHVVRVLDAGAEESTGAPFIVMEYLEGHDLGNLLATRGPMPVAMAVDYIIQICEAVGAAHALGIIHRDLKPSNFFLTKRPDGSALVKVLDFGISKAMAEDGAPDPRLTETQAVFGSPTYMSPEQIRSSKNVDPRSDVWSLGVALFELLTGKMPFNADNVAGLLAAVIADPPMRVTAFAPGVPLDLEAIIFACLEKDPARRIDSCGELAARLAPFGPPEAAQLAARIERGVRHGSSPSLPPSQASRPSAPAPSYGAPLPPLSSPSVPAPSYGAPPPLSAPSAPVAFGRTGGDLSATGPAHRRAPEDKTLRNFAIVIAALAIAVGSVSGLVIVQGRRARAESAARVEPSPSSSVAVTTAAPAEPSASAVASAAAEKVDPGAAKRDPAGAAKGKPGPRTSVAHGAPGAGSGAAAPESARAVPATSAAAPTAPTPPTAPTHPPVRPPGEDLNSRY